jgi:hypothetical protein
MARRMGTDQRNTTRDRFPKDAERSGMPRTKGQNGKAPSCDDCYFRKNLLCALELDKPCATFRPNRPEGLVPPRQPVLLMRAPRWASQGRAPAGDVAPSAASADAAAA